MALLEFTARSGDVVVALTAKTILQIQAAANTPIKVKRCIISGKGVSTTDAPVNVQLVQQTGAGSGGSAVTLVKRNPSDAETLQSAGLSGLTAEPASDDFVIHEFKVHPQDMIPLGSAEYNVPLVPLRGGKRLGVKILAGTTNTFAAELECEE